MIVAAAICKHLEHLEFVNPPLPPPGSYSFSMQAFLKASFFKRKTFLNVISAWSGDG